MRQLTVAQLRSTLAESLKDLPFEIIDGRSKETLAIVSTSQVTRTLSQSSVPTVDSPITHKLKVNKETIPKSKLVPNGTLCRHFLMSHAGCHYEI